MLGNLGTYICTCHTGGRRGRKLHVGVACTETGVAAGFSISFSPYSGWSHADHMHAGHYLESILKGGIVCQQLACNGSHCPIAPPPK